MGRKNNQQPHSDSKTFTVQLSIARQFGHVDWPPHDIWHRTVRVAEPALAAGAAVHSWLGAVRAARRLELRLVWLDKFPWEKWRCGGRGGVEVE
jgi:hypothetical protein